MVTVSKLEQRQKKKKKRRKGALHILEQEGGGGRPRITKGSVSLQIIKDGHNYRGNVIFNGFQQNTYVHVKLRLVAALVSPVERSRMRCYTRSRPSF